MRSRWSFRWWKGVFAVPVLASCAAPESGTATTRVQVDIVVRDCTLDNSAAITITTTETTTPTSEATQAAEAKVDAKASAEGIPK